MRCVETLIPFFGVLFWGLPFFTGYWIWRRKRIPGATTRFGWLVIILWCCTFPLLVLSLMLGISKLEGNDQDVQCWEGLAFLALLVGVYVRLFVTLKRKPKGPA